MPFTHAHWTVDDLRDLPDDGKRYEVVDGVLLVSPSPSLPHQRAVGELYVLLHRYVAGLNIEVFMAPSAITWAADTEVQPDILAVRRAGSRPLAHFEDVQHLALAVEVLSPSTTRADRDIKRRKYQARGVETYWIVNTADRCIERWMPNDAEPEIVTNDLVWHPIQQTPPLVIDLGWLFRVVHGEADG